MLVAVQNQREWLVHAVVVREARFVMLVTMFTNQTAHVIADAITTITITTNS